jgi:hypothetical protein
MKMQNTQLLTFVYNQTTISNEKKKHRQLLNNSLPNSETLKDQDTQFRKKGLTEPSISIFTPCNRDFQNSQ